VTATNLATAAPSTPSPTRAIAYAPALDGLRGLCLLGVMLFHAPFSWAGGGFLGVSTFFTLSGFLFTSLLLDEHERTGRIALGAFWKRRLRRLMPALWVAIAATLTASSLFPSTDREAFAGDALASAFFVANLRFMSPDYAYSQLFASPSPFQHCWSLAIEGQFYLTFPIVVALILRLRRGIAALGWTTAVLLGVSVARGWASSPSAIDRAYYAGDARAGELLVGVGLALALSGLTRRRERPRVAWIGAVALAAMPLVWATTRIDSTWLYRGGFAGYAAISAAVIAAALEPASLVRRTLSLPALRWIGRVSYGAYLYHWPLYLLLAPGRLGLGPVPLLALRFALTFAIAALSSRYLEEPIRRGRMLPGRRFALAGAAATAGVLALALWTSPATARRAVDVVAGAWRSTPAPSPRFRFAFFGDSTARRLSRGLGPWLQEVAGGSEVRGSIKLGCGLLDASEREWHGAWRDFGTCRGSVARWASAARRGRPDLAIVLVGANDVRNFRFLHGGRGHVLGDGLVDKQLRATVAAMIDGFARAGVKVIWLTSPSIELRYQDRESPRSEIDASDPSRMERLNQIVAWEARKRPNVVRVVDLAAELRRWPDGEWSTDLRPDGVHFSDEGARRVADEWLGEAVMRAFREIHPPRRETQLASGRRKEAGSRVRRPK
jgi:peptidoglycan/LPS O-acetylase OafA/YrhL/lysophospholipase L1-like esterase